MSELIIGYYGLESFHNCVIACRHINIRVKG